MFKFLALSLGLFAIAHSSDSLFVLQELEHAKHNAFAVARDDIYEAEGDLADRVNYEFHVGIGIRDHRRFFKTGVMGIKLNPGAGRIGGYGRTRALLVRARMGLDEYRFESARQLHSRIDNLEMRLDAYNNRPWYSRIGLGLTIPLVTERVVKDEQRDQTVVQNNTTGQLDTSNVTIRSYVRTSSELSTDYKYLFSKTAFVLYYDVADLFAVNAGANLDREFTMGISLDISTPVSLMASSFFGMLTGEANVQKTYTSSRAIR